MALINQITAATAGLVMLGAGASADDTVARAAFEQIQECKIQALESISSFGKSNELLSSDPTTIKRVLSSGHDKEVFSINQYGSDISFQVTAGNDEAGPSEQSISMIRYDFEDGVLGSRSETFFQKDTPQMINDLSSMIDSFSACASSINTEAQSLQYAASPLEIAAATDAPSTTQPASNGLSNPHGLHNKIYDEYVAISKAQMNIPEGNILIVPAFDSPEEQMAHQRAVIDAYH